MYDKERTQACNSMKAAVRDYAKDPSGANTAAVEVAWKAFQKLDSISFWRQWKDERLESPGSEPEIKGGSK